MPLVSPVSPMSLGELTVCEDFLDSHREYATDLLSDIESIAKWHRRGPCPGMHKGKACALCELCGADSGMMGATKRALEIYDEAENRLKAVHASLGWNTSSQAAPSRETLFRNSLAKAVFFSIVTTGDSLRSQHATWQTHIRAAISKSFFSSAHVPRDGSGSLCKDGIRDVLSAAYSGPKVVGPRMNPKLAAVSAGSDSEIMSTSSMFVVFRQCLSPDCPCELNKVNIATNTQSSDAGGSPFASKVTPSLTHSQERCSWHSQKTNTPSDAQAGTIKLAQNHRTSTHHDPNTVDARAPDTPRPQDVVAKPDVSSRSTSKIAFLTKATETSSPSLECDTLTVDPRVVRLRAQVARWDDAHRALMAWCRTWAADPQLYPREGNMTGIKASSKYESTMKGTHECPFGLPFDAETAKPAKSPCPAARNGEAMTKGLSRVDDKTTVQELRSDEQEELEKRWLTARQKRCKDQNRYLP